MRAEWRKLASLRSTKWSLFVTLAATLLVTYLSTHGAVHHNQQWYQGFDPTNTACPAWRSGSLVIGVLGVLADDRRVQLGHHPLVLGRNPPA